MIVKCIKRCWDSKKCIHYVRGDEADINPKDPIAMYFEGWPPGTEVYFKKPAGVWGTNPEQGLRKIPGSSD